MKTTLIAIVAVSFAALSSVRAAEPMTELLQKGLFEEEANQNLPEAIKAYESLIQQGEEQRKLLATAVFRLGECYRKLGKTNEAAAQYQRIVREFSDNARLADLSRQYLGQSEAVKPAPVADGHAEDIQVTELKKRIASNPDYVNERASNGTGTPLHSAAGTGNLKVAELLLQHGASAETTDNDQNTPLHIAASAGHRAMVALLIKAKAKIDAVNKRRETPLHKAAAQGYIDIAEILLEANANIHAKADEGMPIHYAARLGKKFMLQMLVKRGADVEGRDDMGATPLHHAAKSAELESLRLLVDNKANVNATNRHAETPLHFAIKTTRTDILEELIKRGADVNAKTSSGHTPAALAWTWKTRDNLELLLAKDADPNARIPGPYNYNDTAGGIMQQRSTKDVTLLIASVLAPSPNVNFTEMLLRYGADPNHLDGEGSTALYHAIRLKQLSTAELLLANKADPNGVHGWLLHSAMSSGPNFVALLLEHKANPNAKNMANIQETPLHWAVESGNAEVIRLLLDAGANVGATDMNGATPLDRAKSLNLSSRNSIIATLRDRGANEYLPRPGFITVVRVQRDVVVPLFFADTNGMNHHTLYEILASAFQKDAFIFPDLKNIRISRSNVVTSIDIEQAFQFQDCAKDLRLLWGDVVEIPEADHNANAKWSLPNEFAQTLTTCTERKVSIVVKGQTNVITLKPYLEPAQNIPTYSRSVPGISGSNPAPASVLTEFRLRGIVLNSNLLRISSDLSRVKVHRMVDGKPVHWVFDLRMTPYDARRDLWLRDGDVIEIPEKGATEVQARK